VRRRPPAPHSRTAIAFPLVVSQAGEMSRGGRRARSSNAVAGQAAVSVAVERAEERSTHVTVWFGEGHAVVGIIGEREPPVVAPNAEVRPCHSVTP
jgi:hypothetical protein